MYKCAIYTRVSTEEQAENPEGSIRNQELRLREYVKLKSLIAPFGEVAAVFSDPGVSAKDMNRPAFQKLLRAVENKQVNLIMVTELSRFTRSMKDFSVLQEFLRKHSCEFLSLRENFDSSSATGNLVMGIMATLAEFERKQTAERISNSFFERAKRGLYNGGAVPLGFRIGDIKNGTLEVVPDEAEVVRKAFAIYQQEGTLSKTAKLLNDSKTSLSREVRGSGGVRQRIWTINLVHKLLTNQAYIGLRKFKDRTGQTKETKAAWEPIIDLVQFKAVNSALRKNLSQKKTHGENRFPYTLSGVIFCGACGHRLSGKSAHGRNRKFAYYSHAYRIKLQECQSQQIHICTATHRLRAERIEPPVWADVKAFLVDDAFVSELFERAKQNRIDPQIGQSLAFLEGSVSKMKKRIEVLADRISGLPEEIDPSDLYKKLGQLQQEHKASLKEIEEKRFSVDPQKQYVDLKDLRLFTETLKAKIDEAETKPEVQARLIKQLVHKVVVQVAGYEIQFFASDNNFMPAISGLNDRDDLLGRQEKAPPTQPNVGRDGVPFALEDRKKSVDSTFFLNGGR